MFRIFVFFACSILGLGHSSQSSKFFDDLNFNRLPFFLAHKTLESQKAGTSKGSTHFKTAFIQIGISYNNSPFQLLGSDNDLRNFFQERIIPRLESNRLDPAQTEFYVLSDSKSYIQKINNDLVYFSSSSFFQNKKTKDVLGDQFINYDIQTNIPSETRLVYGSPTRANIESLLTHVMRKDDLNSIVLHYSGHGSQSRALFDTEEKDGLDEYICPVDFSQKGMISDNWLTQTLVDPMPYKKNLKGLFALMDCCHSGTIFDLPYQAIPRFDVLHQVKGMECSSIRKDRYEVSPKVLLLSGCNDQQVSVSVRSKGEYQSVLTRGFLDACKVLEKKKPYQLSHLFEELYKATSRFTQQPQITTGFCLNEPHKEGEQEVSMAAQETIDQILSPVLD